MFVIMEVVDFIYFFMHSCIVFFHVLFSLLFILILVQVDRAAYVQCRDEFLRNLIASSFLSSNMNVSFFEIQYKDSELWALSLSCIIP